MRVILACERPRGGRDEGLTWLRDELSRVASGPEVLAVTVTELEQARPWVPPAALLIEVELDDGADADAIVASETFAALVSDLRSLRLRPRVALTGKQLHVEEAGA